jgi:peptide/nickel transport system substrate-binding protein
MHVARKLHARVPSLSTFARCARLRSRSGDAAILGGAESYMIQFTRRDFGTGVGVVLGAAFLGGLARADVPQRGGTLVATWGGLEPQALFVPAGGGSSPLLTSSKMLERLVAMKFDFTFAPVLATGWEVSPDRTEYELALRPGVTWHDGKPFGAEDVAFSINEYWRPISSGEALKHLDSAAATGPLSIAVRFKRPVPEFLFLSTMASQGGAVIPKHIYAGRDIITHPANNQVVGTGPWKFGKWVRGSHIEFVRNEAYWQEGLPYLDRLIIRYLRSPSERAAAMETGEIQLGVFNPLGPPDTKRLVATGRFEAMTRGYENAQWSATIEMNTRREIFAKREVRQAILHAIDRSFIADTIYYGYAKPAVSPIGSSNAMFFSPNVPAYPYDPAKAGAMLDAAGYPRKGNGKRFSANLLAAGWFEVNGRIGSYLKQCLEDVGIDVSLTVPDRPTSIKRIYTDYDYDIALSNWANPAEPVPSTTQYYTTSGIIKGAAFRNATGFSNQAMDDVVVKLTFEIDPEKRKALAHEFARLAMTEAPIVPLVEIESLTVASKRVHGHSDTPDYMASSWGRLWLEA